MCLCVHVHVRERERGREGGYMYIIATCSGTCISIVLLANHQDIPYSIPSFVFRAGSFHSLTLSLSVAVHKYQRYITSKSVYTHALEHKSALSLTTSIHAHLIKIHVMLYIIVHLLVGY